MPGELNGFKTLATVHSAEEGSQVREVCAARTGDAGAYLLCVCVRVCVQCVRGSSDSPHRLLL